MTAPVRGTATPGGRSLTLPALTLPVLGLFIFGAAAHLSAALAETNPPLPQVEFLSVEPPAAGGAAAATGPERGNPLWAVPLERLSATRDRPLFTPSRRPPEPAVAKAPAPPVSPPPPAPARPPLVLMGTVVSTTGSLGIFTDQASGRVLRLRVGENHAGWTLRSVGPRDVVMHAGAAHVTLPMPAPAQGGPEPPRGSEGPFAAAQVGRGKPVAGQVVVPRRVRPSPADLDSSH